MQPQTPCQSLTSRRDSGSGNVVSPSSLIAMSKKDLRESFLCNFRWFFLFALLRKRRERQKRFI
ncbi:hypothetical protein EHQ91_02260 [Leptospira biflexa]|nr:hypothetical protein EHQ91_02260 [Leptospira biflexa]